MAMIKFIYTNANGNSLEFSKESGIWITSFDGLSSNDVEVSEATVSAQIGASMTGKSVKPKDLTAEGLIRYKADNPGEIYQRRRNILAVILPGVDATIRYINTVSGDDVYWEGTPTRTPVFGNNPTLQRFQFTFYAPFPYPRFSEKSQTEFNVLHSGFRFPQSYSSTVPWKISSKENDRQRSVVNSGTISAGFTVTFKAEADAKGPGLINVFTQERISFSGLTLLAGEILEICTKPNEKRATRIRADGSKENVFYLSDFDSVFFELAPGENVLQYSAETNQETLQATLVFDPTVAGV